MQGRETALAAAQDDTEAATKSAAALTRELKKARASAVTGQLRDLAKALAQAEQLAAELAEQITGRGRRTTSMKAIYSLPARTRRNCSPRPPRPASACSRKTAGCSATPP